MKFSELPTGAEFRFFSRGLLHSKVSSTSYASVVARLSVGRFRVDQRLLQAEGQVRKACHFRVFILSRGRSAALPRAVHLSASPPI